MSEPLRRPCQRFRLVLVGVIIALAACRRSPTEPALEYPATQATQTDRPGTVSVVTACCTCTAPLLRFALDGNDLGELSCADQRIYAGVGPRQHNFSFTWPGGSYRGVLQLASDYGSQLRLFCYVPPALSASLRTPDELATLKPLTAERLRLRLVADASVSSIAYSLPGDPVSPGAPNPALQRTRYARR